MLEITDINLPVYVISKKYNCGYSFFAISDALTVMTNIKNLSEMKDVQHRDIKEKLQKKGL